ncbi:MAG: mercuric reductase [Acidobacteriota bacterium]|nr:mercuric reductase [Acidobacteriota bacterium]
MNESGKYDAIIIGSGQGGTPLSTALAGAGFKTALIEREHIGGTCINEGCTPTKTLIASGRVAYLARRGAEYGVKTSNIAIDMERVRRRKRNIVDTFRNGSESRLTKTGNLDLIFGNAQFSGRQSITVKLRSGSECELSAEKIIINAGCRPALPTLNGLQDIPFLNSTSVMELDSVPEHLVVLGGGYVGLEFGQLFRRLGSRVSIVHTGTQLLSHEDADVAQEVAAIMQQDGLDILLSTKAERVENSGGGIVLTIRDHLGSRTVAGSYLLVATGRTPNTAALNLPAAEISVDGRGYIKVNSKLETTAEGIFAIGDINGGPAFTHISYDDFRILRANFINKGNASTEGRLVPYTVYTDPQLGRIGITEADALQQKKKFRVAKMPMSSVARALEVDETRGFMKAIVEDGTDQILGAAILGIEGGEIMSMLELAMMGKLPFTALRDAIFAHPTLAESLNNLFTHFAS